jgi:hypothetical protein
MCGTCQNLEFVKQRDGAEAACAFARQGRKAYRIAILGPRLLALRFASTGERYGGGRGKILRRAMTEAYLCSKKYLLTCQQA